MKLPQDYRINSSRILRKFYVTTRRYCPLCLGENKMYKLIWQIKGINFCSLHKTALVSICPKCNTKIHLLARNGDIGFCPSCEAELSSAIPTEYSHNETEDLLINIWESFFDSKTPKFQAIKNLTYNQTLAIKLLFFLRNYRYNVIKNQLITFARENSYNSTLHVDYIINLLLKIHTSFSSFLTTDIPHDFINNIVRENMFDENNIKLSFLLRI